MVIQVKCANKKGWGKEAGGRTRTGRAPLPTGHCNLVDNMAPFIYFRQRDTLELDDGTHKNYFLNVK